MMAAAFTPLVTRYLGDSARSILATHPGKSVLRRCSQIRITRQPDFRRSLLILLSRSTLRLSFFRQKAAR